MTQDPVARAPILNIAAFEMSTEIKNLPSVFVSHSSRSVSLRTARARLILNLRIYNRIQSVLKQKLGDRVRNYVLDIPSNKKAPQLTSSRPPVNEPHDATSSRPTVNEPHDATSSRPPVNVRHYAMGREASRITHENENSTFSQGGRISRTNP